MEGNQRCVAGFRAYSAKPGFARFANWSAAKKADLVEATASA
jgi:hypothetical protein